MLRIVKVLQILAMSGIDLNLLCANDTRESKLQPLK